MHYNIIWCYCYHIEVSIKIKLRRLKKKCMKLYTKLHCACATSLTKIKYTNFFFIVLDKNRLSELCFLICRLEIENK